MPKQLDHAADRFQAMRRTIEQAASDSRGQFQIPTGTDFALESQETQDGARVVREREEQERARAEAEAKQGRLF